jgi:sugar/nucleoside kinase (ribokinase family)
MPRLILPAASSAANTAAAALLVSGTVAYDDILTPRGSATRILGGSASYAALAASYFTDVRIAGLVGADFEKKDLLRLQAHSIDTAGLRVEPTGETFFWRGRYHENYNHRDTLETRLGVNTLRRPPLPPGHSDTPFILLANDAPALQLAVLDQLTAPRFVLADTMNLWIDTAREELQEIIRRVDLLIVNDGEAAQLSGESNLYLGAARIQREYGARTLIVKKGEHGALLFHPEGLFLLPAFPVTELRDPTGAGDSFAGALTGVLAALGRVDFEALKLAMLYATAVASLTVEAFSCDRLESAGVSEIASRADYLRTITTLL